MRTLLVAFVKYTLSQGVIAIVIETLFFGTFWRVETLALWQKVVQNLLIFMFLFCPENSRAGSRKTSVTL